MSDSDHRETGDTLPEPKIRPAPEADGLTPLLLLHGLGMSARVWDPVRAGLGTHHDVVAHTILGHRGGAPAPKRPVVVDEFVDDVERMLDTVGISRPHVAGNSLGGWVAIELARRGRALSVCALSPAGAWHAGTTEQTLGVRKIRRALRSARFGRGCGISLALRSGVVRRLVFRDVAEHGDRLSAAQAMSAVDDLLGCDVIDDILSTDEELALLDPLPCPVTLAWSGDDAIVPLAVNGAVARARLPGARFVVLAGVGHVPMIDNPQQVIAVILQTIRDARRSAASSSRLAEDE
jgi:pimeloyl-ACP methyl ester carboxylesterase